MFSPNAVAVFSSTPAVEPNPSWLEALVQDDPIGWSDWLDTFPDLHTTDEHGRTPLHWACRLRRTREVHDLLMLGADPWRPDQDGVFPWQMAMRWRADASWSWDQWDLRYPSAFAWGEPHDAWRTVCIARAILHAAMYDRLDVVYALTRATDVRSCPGMPLSPIDGQPGVWQFLPWAHAVVMLNLVHAFPLLQAWGIRLDDTDQEGRTAVQWGVALQRPDLVDMLLHAGAALTDVTVEPLVLDEHATRPDPVSLAMALSPAMAHWIGQHVHRLAPGSSIEQDVLDTAEAVHGASAMARALFDGWKRDYRWVGATGSHTH